jgi:hypothetical protein
MTSMQIEDNVQLSVNCNSDIVLLSASTCSPFSIPVPQHGSKECTQKSGASGYNCTVTCNAGYYFYDYPDQSSVTFDCNANTNIWDKPIIPACTIGKIIVICYIIIQSNLSMHSPVLKGHLYLVLS